MKNTNDFALANNKIEMLGEVNRLHSIQILWFLDRKKQEHLEFLS